MTTELEMTPTDTSGPLAGITLDTVTMDSTDALGLATWWATQTDGRVLEHFGFYSVTHEHGRVPSLGFQQVDRRTPGKNATHLDLRVQDPAAAVETLVLRGATVVARHSLPDGFEWSVLADPDGNQFCILPL
jgi:hypothetical protein